MQKRPFAVRDVYFLIVHEPRPHPVSLGLPVNVVIVHALTLLRADLPQPGAARIYRCLTEFPGRIPGCVVPLSALTYELDDGRLWPQVADWRAVTEAIRLAFDPDQGQRPCRSFPLSVDYPYDALLALAVPTRSSVKTPPATHTTSTARSWAPASGAPS